MQDCFHRTIDYLRVSVTDRCNFRCVYCMPSEGVAALPHAEILSYEEMLRIIAAVSRYGVRKIRLTGGEPLVRKGIVEFVQSIAKLGTVTDLAMTTNGSLFAPVADKLKQAGLQRVNFSLDTADPQQFAAITRRGRLDETLTGIQSALQAGLSPVKINVVLTAAFSTADLDYFIEQVYHYPVAVRFIEYMPIGASGIGPGFSIKAIKEMLNKAGRGLLQPVATSRGNGPARYFQLPRSIGTFGFITPISEHFCQQCNRIRLTADGKFRPCLLSNLEIDVKTALRLGASDQLLTELFLQAVREKPAHHSLCRTSGHPGFERSMSQIGG
jgi:GTP 3',8-cyclase